MKKLIILLLLLFLGCSKNFTGPTNSAPVIYGIVANPPHMTTYTKLYFSLTVQVIDVENDSFEIIWSSNYPGDFKCGMWAFNTEPARGRTVIFQVPLKYGTQATAFKITVWVSDGEYWVERTQEFEIKY